MPVNSRYLGNTYSSSSSLYKKAQAAQKKMQSLEDTEAKFLFDTNQISNEDYLGYVQKRKNEVTDPTEQMSWTRSELSVKKEIRSDYRAEVLLDVSKTPGNSSNDVATKLGMIANLYQMAYDDNDADSLVSLETQYNNTLASYQTKLETEAKAGIRASINAIEHTYNIAMKGIQGERIDIKNMPDLSPDQKFAKLADLDAKETAVNLLRLNACYDSDGNVDEVKLGTIQNKIATLQGSLAQNSKYFVGELKDQYGNIYDPANPQEGQVVTDFTPFQTTDPLGVTRLQLAEGYTMAYGDAKPKIIDMTTGNEVNVTYDANNQPMITEGATIDKTQYTEMNRSDGTTYYSKILTEKYPQKTEYNPDGTVKPSTAKDTPADRSYILDENGQRWDYSAGRQNFSSPAKDKSYTDAVNELKATNPSNTQNYTKGLFNLSPMERENARDTASKKVVNSVNMLASRAKAEADATNKQWATANPAVAKAQATSGATAQVNTVNPFTLAYNQPKNAPAPYKLPTPSVAQQQNATNILSPTGIIGQMYPKSIGGSPQGQLLGETGGVKYYRVSKADGGYDFIKGDNFKLSENDAIKELGKKTW